jgi:hypothetical protein
MYKRAKERKKDKNKNCFYKRAKERENDTKRQEADLFSTNETKHRRQTNK